MAFRLPKAHWQPPRRFHAPLETLIVIASTTYYAVRVAMDLADETFLVLDDSDFEVCLIRCSVVSGEQ